jgi:hypothetical protein
MVNEVPADLRKIEGFLTADYADEYGFFRGICRAGTVVDLPAECTYALVYRMICLRWIAKNWLIEMESRASVPLADCRLCESPSIIPKNLLWCLGRLESLPHFTPEGSPEGSDLFFHHFNF